MKQLMLMKNLPQCPKGRIFKEDVNGDFFHSMTDIECIEGELKLYKFTKKEVLDNPDWFILFTNKKNKMAKPKTVRKTTTIDGEEIGLLVIDWNLEIESDIPEDRHEDDFSHAEEEYKSVGTIFSIEYQMFGKVGIDITKKVMKDKKLLGILEDKLLES